MKKIILITLLFIPSLISIAQNQDEFYSLGTAIGVSKTFIGHDQNPINGKVTDSDGKLRPFESSPNIWGIVLLWEWNETGIWAINMGIKSQLCDDVFYMVKRAKNTNSTDPESPWFSSFFELNCGLNVFYDRTIRAAAGISGNAFIVEAWDNQGDYLAQRGTYINLGPYFSGDYMLSKELLLKLGVSVTVPVSKNVEVSTAKKPVFINFTPGIMMNNGFFLGIDYTIISGLEDSAPGKVGTSLSASRLELKLALFTDFL